MNHAPPIANPFYAGRLQADHTRLGRSQHPVRPARSTPSCRGTPSTPALCRT